MAGFYDLGGVLTFADTQDAAPVIHFDGPPQVTFSGSLPQLRVGRSTDFNLAVGTPGVGGGTFAAFAYQDTIPAGVHPTATVVWPGGSGTDAFELKYRC